MFLQKKTQIIHQVFSAQILKQCLASFALTTFIIGCAPTRQPLPSGEIPKPNTITAADEEYGHQVLSSLTQQFPLDQNDQNIERSRRVVDRITASIGADKDPWHVYVLKADNINNAGATKGNHIFVWSGLLNTIKNDDELAVIISHEIGHILAEHPQLTPNEQTSIMITGVAGQIARDSAIYSGSIDIVAQLAKVVTEQTLAALLVNPGQQQKELEADMIGLHLMAEAKIDPRIAVNFWRKNLDNPNFSSGLPQFLSSHPASRTRLKQLEQQLPLAIKRYDQKRGRNFAQAAPTRRAISSKSSTGDEKWRVEDNSVTVYDSLDSNRKTVTLLKQGQTVNVKRRTGRWLEITSPVSGFVRSPALAPLN